MIKWPEFLSLLTGHNTIEIIGPLAVGWTPKGVPSIFVDGGCRLRKPAPLTVSVGDGDSSSPEAMDVLINKDKDFSDFAFALRSLPQNIVEVKASGFLGGRRDHELANLGEAFAFLKARLKPTRIVWDAHTIAWSAGHWEFTWNGLFSIFSFESAKISLEGECRYRLQPTAEIGPLSSFGLSNQAFGKVQLQTNSPILWISQLPDAKVPAL